MLTQKRLKEAVRYDPDTGLFLRILKNKKTKPCGKYGGKDFKGPYQISIDTKKYLTHRLAWLYVYGYMPENDIDHINRDCQDNRIANLREVSRSCNCMNKGLDLRNKSGIKGVLFKTIGRKWRVTIMANGENIYLGRYKCLLEAACYRLAAEQCFGFEDCYDPSTAHQYVKNNTNS